VAFCTQNIVPGIDFSNDPLLQGRNFSYLDTQLKRLGGPNFTHLPINAPKCPFAHFQQDGHMAMLNPKGQINYEPNSLGVEGGPRETPHGFKSVATQEADDTKLRIRPESFADHYSQARQFFISQTPIEQKHIADALVFELSKVERVVIRTRMVSHLLNIDKCLAQKVADGLRLKEMPNKADTAKPTRIDLEVSSALSILLNGPERFEGRKLGIFLTDGADAKLLNALKAAAHKEGAAVEIIAPHIGGVKMDDASWVDAQHKIDGGPSVIFDAVVLLFSDKGVKLLLNESSARDFVADAFAHMKFIGYTEAALPLMEKAGIADSLDKACIPLSKPADAKAFIQACGKLRFWEREIGLDMAPS
jgi:catalase